MTGPASGFKAAPGPKEGENRGAVSRLPPSPPPPRVDPEARELRGGDQRRRREGRGTGRSHPPESPSGSAALPADIRLRRNYSLRWDDNRVRRESGWGTQRSPWGPCGTARTDLRTPGHTDTARSRAPGDRARGTGCRDRRPGTDGRAAGLGPGTGSAARGQAGADARGHTDTRTEGRRITHALCRFHSRGAGSAAGVSTVGSSAQPGFLLQPGEERGRGRAAGARTRWDPLGTEPGCPVPLMHPLPASCPQQALFIPWLFSPWCFKAAAGARAELCGRTRAPPREIYHGERGGRSRPPGEHLPGLCTAAPSRSPHRGNAVKQPCWILPPLGKGSGPDK
ncbi:uncharacterized protein [Patagioenas fasciata]|uniref:uncharacterized protein n=1 Tax=Patagioenas fasciata TaxID=372321 RepID=UPI0032E8614A